MRVATKDTCAIAVMAKASIPGLTKTRLAPPLTADEAAALNTAFLRDIADKLLAAGATSNVFGYMAYAPAGSQSFFQKTMPPEIGLIETVRPSLGLCLLHALSEMLGKGYGAACVLNSDSPTLPVSYLTTAATILAAPGDRAVIGPSTDGGYYLLGVKTAHARLFEDIAWSTERVFAQTLERAREIGLEVAVLPDWYDVDDGPSLNLLASELIAGKPFRRVGGSDSSPAHTRACLTDMMANADLQARLGMPR